jgi:hypothetical protein
MKERLGSAADENPYWFRAKRYGWGWGLPTRWQGWVVLTLYFASIIVAAAVIEPARAPGRFLACLVVLSGLLVAVCWAKGEPPRWRWGDRDRRSSSR